MSGALIVNVASPPRTPVVVAAICRLGRLLLPSWCKADALSRTQENLVLDHFMRYWGIPSLETPRSCKRHFARSGLRLLEEMDLNASVRRNWSSAMSRH